ncbi:MAG: peptidase M48, partial [Desulfuromonadales bacterium]|nr:peptidase M48 [Desulfuromonadales bacterium]
EGKQQDWLSGLFASHPASRERVQNNIDLMATLPKGGELGVARYRTKIAHLLKTKPAYEAYDEGRKALTKDDIGKAGRLAQQAIALEPKEALFYGLMGDVEQENQRLKPALKHYYKATQLNPNFFYYYLQRGKVEEQLHLNIQAQTDLERSVELLPTADAYNSLGNLAKNAGRLDEAKAYYTKVGSQGELGQKAYGSLVDLDLQDNPAKYIEVRAGQDAQGRIVVQINNSTPRKIGGIVLVLQTRNAAGKVQKLRHNLEGTVTTGSQQLFDLGLTGKLTQEQIKTLQAVIVGAKVVR